LAEVAPNRLAQEPSPYLRQHADNPVDWWPWSDEAFAAARLRDVPVLISVGYSACHWCHVMAHESFEDAEVAQVLNAGFVAVKVDREERPDVDAVYMEAVQLCGAGGGWPMTVIALPDERPFWTGTYLPKGRFLGLLRRVGELWASHRADIETEAGRLADAVRRGAELPGLSASGRDADLDLAQLLSGQPEGGTAFEEAERGEGGSKALPGAGAVARAAEALLERYDPQWGGFGGAPKFPQPTTLEVLAQHSWRSGDGASLDALRRTLDAMSSGGIYDHLGGGFARYSTDRRWLVPHFEKMLYDNALLVLAYTHAWQLTGSPRYRQVVEETVGYLLSPPLRLAEGAWAAAEDADSEGEEGRFYVWDFAELTDVAGLAAGEWYGASPKGNWEGKNILWRPDLAGIARPPDIEVARVALLERRSARPRPGLDDKVLTEWNAMATAALAYAGSAFAQPTWVAAAVATAEVLVAQLRRSDGRWLRSWRPGTEAGAARAGGRHLAYAGDYAWLVEAFTRLGEATGHARWPVNARETANVMLELFWDKENGGFFTAGSDAEPLIARMKDVYDGAVPSANATAVLALARLGELTGEPYFTDVARQTIGSMAPAMSRSPIAFPGMALAAGYVMSPKREVVVTTSDQRLVRPVWERYLPDTVLAWAEPYPSPLWEGRDEPSTRGRAYFCESYTCKLPVSEPEELAALLDKGPT
jgi:uncharacterized protein